VPRVHSSVDIYRKFTHYQNICLVVQGDYTRTGEIRFAGMMKDGVNSANRSLFLFKYTLHCFLYDGPCLVHREVMLFIQLVHSMQ